MQPHSFDSDAPTPPQFDLRPLSTGELMDRSFALFRASFLLCVGIGMVPALLSTVQVAVRLVYLKAAHLSPLTSMWTAPVLGIITALFSLLSLFVFGWSSAGICWAASRRYLGRPATVKEAYQVVLHHWFRYPAVMVLQLLRSAWLPIVLYAVGFGMLAGQANSGNVALRIIAGLVVFLAFLSIFFAMYLYIRLSLGMPAAIMEDLSAGAALSRSKDLLQTRKGRVFLVLLLIAVLYFVLSIFVGIASVAFVRGHVGLAVMQAMGLVLNFASALVLQPLLMVALCVVYYDERVRRDGYDLVVLMEGADSTDVSGAPETLESPEPTFTSDRAAL